MSFWSLVPAARETPSVIFQVSPVQAPPPPSRAHVAQPARCCCCCSALVPPPGFAFIELCLYRMDVCVLALGCFAHAFDHSGVRFKVVKVSSVSLLALFKGKKAFPLTYKTKRTMHHSTFCTFWGPKFPNICAVHTNAAIFNCHATHLHNVGNGNDVYY